MGNPLRYRGKHWLKVKRKKEKIAKEAKRQ